MKNIEIKKDQVEDIEEAVGELQAKGIEIEPIRVDEFTHKKFTFFTDPDGLPIELMRT